ncbi:MAG: helix-turn-helix domain-containing protein [Acidimicrobiia bacterium]
MTAADDDERHLRSALGKAIRLRRVELDLSRADLAREADVSYPYVSEIENGTKQASSKTLWRIARALGLEPHELMASAAQWSEAAPAPGGPAPGSADLLSVLGVSRSLAAGISGGAFAAAAPKRSRWFHADRVPPEPAVGAGPSTAAAGPPELVEVLDRIDVALEGVPDERAELALMLSLDERRTRRIVREELDRRNVPRR